MVKIGVFARLKERIIFYALIISSSMKHAKKHPFQHQDGGANKPQWPEQKPHDPKQNPGHNPGQNPGQKPEWPHKDKR